MSAEIDGGLQSVKLAMPAIITTDLRLNEPLCLAAQYESQKKPIDEKIGHMASMRRRVWKLSKWRNLPGAKPVLKLKRRRIGRQAEKRAEFCDEYAADC